MWGIRGLEKGRAGGSGGECKTQQSAHVRGVLTAAWPAEQRLVEPVWEAPQGALSRLTTPLRAQPRQGSATPLSAQPRQGPAGAHQAQQ